jgi:NAD(P)-dependent dehydrogenase (short-subunit alcohol dehydrogenase family)
VSERSVAFITGASRGIGKACAIALANAGFDIAVTARTVHEGEAREHSATLRTSDTRPIPGSLTTTAAAVSAAGRDALVVPADLLDSASVRTAVGTVLDRWGRVDVVVHNARYVGPGHMDRFLDTPIPLLEQQLAANVIAPLIIDQLVLPGMLQRGGGTIIDITSAVAYADPVAPAGEGGWGMGYGISKAAFHRVAGFLAVELGDKGIRAFNVQPGVIATERGALDSTQFGFGDWGAPPEVVGAVVAWLATYTEAGAFAGRTVEAQFLCAERDLLPGWRGPEPNRAAIRYDRSGADLERLEDQLAARSQGS